MSSKLQHPSPIHRRDLLVNAAAFAAAAAVPAAFAQPAFPSRGATILVGVVGGGTNDIVARMIAQGLTQKWGHTVNVENRPGANTQIATDILLNANPDGYTMQLASTGPVTMLPITKGPRYATSRYTCIALAVEFTVVVVTAADSPYNNLNDFIDAARANPGKLSYGSSGVGSISNLQGEYIKHITKTDIQHVPYKGDANAIPDAVSGRVSVALLSLGGVTELMKSGQLKALATLSGSRNPSVPQLRTAKEQGIDIVVPVWNGIFGPPGMPQPLADKINADINEALANPALQDRFAALGVVRRAESSAWFTDFVGKEAARWSDFVKAANIKLE